MKTCSLAPIVVGGLLLISAGCKTTHPTVPVVVRDAETHAPIPGADVRLSSPGADRSLTGTTGPDGLTRIPIAAHDAAVLAQVSAAGYLSRDADVTARPNQKPGEPAVVEIYAGPRPTVELVLPNGFQGIVKARVRVKGDAPPGARAFVFTVPGSGVVEVDGPAVLTQSPGPVFSAKYENGAPLPADAGDAAVGFRWLWAEGPEEVFVVGTRADLAAAAKALGHAPENGTRKGTGGGGGGRHGGRGGGMGGRGGGMGGGY